MDPNDSQHVFVATSPLLESKDGGHTFAPESLSNVHVDNHALWMDPHDAGHRILGNDGGAYVTYDAGKAWWHMPLPIGQFYTVIVDSSLAPYQICGGLQDNGVWCGPSASRDSSGISDADWYPVNGGDGMWVQVPPHDPLTVYSGWQYGNVSKLDLRTWERTISCRLRSTRAPRAAIRSRGAGRRRSSSPRTTRAPCTSARTACSG